MNKLEVLQNLNLGNSVAEYDDALENYFVSTPALNEFLSDRWDIVRGTKGSGKTALLIGVIKGQSKYTELANVYLKAAVNHQGDPIFKQVFYQISSPSEDKLTDSWKIYLISIAMDVVRVHCSDTQELASISTGF
jgi:hypothetical protein